MHPLIKVWVDFKPLPKNTFIFRVNDDDIYSLVKEEADYDPSKTTTLKVDILKVNDIKTISGSMPWIINDVEDKIQAALGMSHLNSLEIKELDCKSWVVNELIDLLCCYDLPENGLAKLQFIFFK